MKKCGAHCIEMGTKTINRGENPDKLKNSE
jgi:hypothetical protein